VPKYQKIGTDKKSQHGRSVNCHKNVSCRPTAATTERFRNEKPIWYYNIPSVTHRQTTDKITSARLK